MRTYYTTAASTWGTQSYESYTGADSTQNTYSASSTSSYPLGGDTVSQGVTSYSSLNVTSNSSANYSLTQVQSSFSSSRYESSTYTSTETYYDSQTVSPFDTVVFSRYYSSLSSTSYSSSGSFLTFKNLTGVTYSSSESYSYSSYLTDIYEVTDRLYGSTTTIILDTTTSTSATFSTSTSSTSSYSSDVVTVSTFPVGSYQITLFGFTTYETNVTSNFQSTQTYGDVSGTTPYTSTSLVWYTNNTSTGTLLFTYTSSASSQTITVTMNPRVEYVKAYDRATDERLFAITYQFANTTKLLSEALSEFGNYTESPLTILTNTTSATFVGFTSSSTTGSSSVASVYPLFTQTRASYSVIEPYANTNPYFGGYVQGVTSVTFGEGPFDVTQSNITAGSSVTQRFFQTPLANTTYTNTMMRINPLSYLSFGPTTTDYQNIVLTYNTTSLATP